MCRRKMGLHLSKRDNGETPRIMRGVFIVESSCGRTHQILALGEGWSLRERKRRTEGEEATLVR